MIKNIVFDIGGVLTELHWKEFVLNRGVPEELEERVTRATFGSKQWAELDRGVLPFEAIVDLLVENDPEMEAYIRHILDYAHEFVLRADHAIPWIKSLKERGFKTYCLSNYNGVIWEHGGAALDFFPLLDGGIRSFEVKLIKPEPEIYRALLDKYSLIPGETVFIDDVEMNVSAARELGIHGILFKSYPEAARKLDELIESEK